MWSETRFDRKRCKCRCVQPRFQISLSWGGGVSAEDAGSLGGVGGGLHVSPASGSSGGDAGLVGVVGSVTSDVLGVGSSGPGPGAGSGECDGGEV